MIEIQHISKAFNGRDVLLDVSATFESGKTSLVIGASGTGKSVLMKCMLDLVHPEKGQVLFDRRPFLGTSEVERKDIRREMGVLFQGGALFDSQTVHQNIQFPLDMLTSWSEAEKRDRVEFCLERVGLQGTGNRMPSEISGGMKKRVGIARAIVMNPQYLFVDEPNSGLDPLTSIKIDQLIKEITEEFKTTTVIITHDMNSVLTIGDYILFLHKGKKVWEGNSQTILESTPQEVDDFVFSNEALRRLRSQ
ncbi:MAG: ABC transporter ATP-binding protein [Spirosomataceae bacterium]